MGNSTMWKRTAVQTTVSSKLGRVDKSISWSSAKHVRQYGIYARTGQTGHKHELIPRDAETPPFFFSPKSTKTQVV